MSKRRDVSAAVYSPGGTMKPALALGACGAPEVEFFRDEIYPLMALVLDADKPLPPLDRNQVLAFFQGDFLFLDSQSQGVFRRLADVCEQIVSGSLDRFDIAVADEPAFAGFLRPHVSDGTITNDVRAAAKRLLDFLEANPAHWASFQKH